LSSNNIDETKSKEDKNKNNGSKKNAHHWQSEQYRSWWKQVNIKMALSEDHASCWVKKDLNVTTKQIHASLTVEKALGRKEECQVQLTGIEREYWMGTEISRLGGNNQALLKVVKNRVGEGGKATLVGGPDADILQEAIKGLQKRTTAGAAMFLVKVTEDQGEPANEEADIQTDTTIRGKDVPTEWRDRTNRASLHMARASLKRRYSEQ